MGVYKSPSRRTLVRFAIIAAILLAWMAKHSCSEQIRWFPAEPDTSVSAEQAWENRTSGVWVEVRGRVERLLSDDEEGSRHQRFVIRVPSGLTLLIAHNIDLAPRVPVTLDDQVAVRGQYEWNEKGGLIHWTHHDPKGKLKGGWISLGDESYR